MTLGMDPMTIPYCKLILVISFFNNEIVELKGRLCFKMAESWHD